MELQRSAWSFPNVTSTLDYEPLAQRRSSTLWERLIEFEGEALVLRTTQQLCDETRES
jgi:hypothetical protein